MRSLFRRCWHANFGHRDVNVDLTQQPWVAECSCGYRFHVKEFAMGKIG